MENILVTGAAGFIGFHLSNKLAELGYHVIGLDNFNDYYNPQLKQARKKQLNDANISIYEGDICNEHEMESLIKKYSVDHVVHLAAQAGVRYSLQAPQAYVKSNIEGFLSILEACRKHNLPLVYASSSSVYGRNEKVPYSIADPCDKQASFYGVTKRANELMANNYYHLYGLKNIGLRFFTVYGPWGRPDMAYWLFAKAILHGQPINVYNEGKLKRDFTYIDDIINGVLAALQKVNSATCELYNLGNEQPATLEAFIDIIENTLNLKAIKHYLPMQKGDVLQTYADITLSKEKLGYSPKVSLDIGIPRFINWFVTNEYYKL